MKIDGQAIATGIYAELRRKPVPRGRMAVVLIGAGESSLAFIARKEAVAQSLGIDFRRVVFSGGEPQDSVLAAIRDLASDDSVGGIILQLPVPKQ